MDLILALGAGKPRVDVVDLSRHEDVGKPYMTPDRTNSSEDRNRRPDTDSKTDDDEDLGGSNGWTAELEGFCPRFVLIYLYYEVSMHVRCIKTPLTIGFA